MAEKINLFELGIDVDAVLKSQEELKKQLDASKASLDELKKSGDTTSKTYIELDASVKALNKEYTASQNQLGKMIQLQGKEIKTVEQGRNALSILNKEWTKQASLYGANSKEADALAKKTLEVRNRLKELEKGVGDNTRNVGNYSESFKEAIGQTTLFGRAQGVVNKVFSIATPVLNTAKKGITDIKESYKAGSAEAKAYSGSQKLAAHATNLSSASLKVLKVALIATGLGAFLVLLGSGVALFSKTQKGIDLVNKVLASFGAGIDVVIDRLSKLGGAFGKLLSGDVSGAFNDMKDAASGFGDELQREIGLAFELEAAFQKLRDREIGLIETQAARQQKIEELRLAAKDEQADLRERARLLQQAGEIEEQMLADRLAIAREDARISQERLDLGESTREDIKANAELQARVIELETESLKRRRSIEAEKQGLLKRARAEEAAAAKEAQANAQRVIDAAIKENKTRLALYIEQNKAEAATLEAGLSKAEEIRDRRLAILQQEVEAGKKTQTEAELERLQIKNDFLEEQKNLVVQFAQEELEIYISNHQSRIDANQLLNDQLVEQEIDRLTKVAEAEKQFQQTRLEQGEISQREYNEAIAAIDEEARLAKEEIELELEEQKKEQAAIDLENERIANEERLAYDQEYALAQYQEGYEKRKAAAIAAGADLTKFEAAEAKTRQDIERQVQQNKLALASQALGTISSILGKETAAGKAFAIAQATIDTYKAANLALGTLPPPAGAIMAAVSIAAGVANVAKISSTKVPKAEKGALFDIGGKRHSAGGTKFYGEDGTIFEAEQGELIGVLNRNAAQAFHGLNSMFPAGGGTGVNYFATGGMVQRAVSAGVQGGSSSTAVLDLSSVEQMAELIAEANSKLPPPITDVKDVISEVGKRNTLVDGANF